MKLIGRSQEFDLIETMLKSKQHVLLEGPVGAGKTTLALEVARKISKHVIRVDGDGRFTEQKLVGSFDPKIVLQKGFKKQAFLPGPLYQAMSEGSVLLINELNRMPEMVQNVLLPALDERKIQIPILGELLAKDGFCMIATQNPREFVATSPLSEALLDRLEWVSISYLSRDEEIEIVHQNTHLKSSKMDSWIGKAVDLTRATRQFPKIKRGASIRAAVSVIQILEKAKPAELNEDYFWQIAKSVFANRIELQVGKFSSQSYSVLLDEILSDLKTELKKKSI